MAQVPTSLDGGVGGLISSRKLTEEGITDFVEGEVCDELQGRVHGAKVTLSLSEITTGELQMPSILF